MFITMVQYHFRVEQTIAWLAEHGPSQNPEIFRGPTLVLASGNDGGKIRFDHGKHLSSFDRGAWRSEIRRWRYMREGHCDVACSA